MKNTIFYLVVMLCVTTAGYSQKNIVIAGKKPGFFINHTVAPKENLYSIGRMYNSSPSLYIAPFNNIKLNDILKDNQVIKVPLTQYNFTRSKHAADTMALIPVYYMVQAKDGLTKIAESNDISAANLKQWNKLTTDVIKVGQPLVVGYLVVNPRLSPLVTAGNNIVASTVVKPATPQVPLPSTIEKKGTTAPPVTAPIVNTTTLANVQEDYFRKYYTGVGSISKQVAAAPFSSNANATMRKYYVFMNLVNAGTIIKITNTQNNKTVFAQVIAGLDNASYNSGIQMRLNDIALAALGLSTENNISNLTISY
jgi:LysM repeat protein